MSSLVTIPQELREKIIQYLLTSDITNPVDLSRSDLISSNRSELSKDKLKQGKVVRSWTGTQYLFFEEFRPVLHPIFSVNRQLSFDAKLVLGRIKASYHLDVVMINEVFLFPKWLMIPKPAIRVDTLTCDFRIARSAELEDRGGRYKGFRGGDGAGPAIAWVVYGLLELFLSRGPSFGNSSSDIFSAQITGYTINNLVINVETPPGVDPSRFGNPLTGFSFGRRREEIDTKDHILDPKYLVDFIRREISSLLYMGYHTAEYGDILYENIGKIIILLDGETKYIYDLSEILEKLTPHFEGATLSQKPRIEAFHDWKARALARRNRLGFGIATDAVDTTLEYKNYSDCYPAGGLYGGIGG